MADPGDGGPTRPAAQSSTAELIQRAVEQTSRLVRYELALVRLEVTRKAKTAGIGAGLLGSGALFGVCGLGALVAAAILALALVIPAWAAALVVAVVFFFLAGMFALVGLIQVRRAVPPVPEVAVTNVRADIEAVTAAVRDGRRP